jgi:hypothetical protein
MVRRGAVETRPKVGDRVTFPFGFEELEGEVYRVEGGELVWVTVEYSFDSDDDEPDLLTFPLDRIKPAQAA